MANEEQPSADASTSTSADDDLPRRIKEKMGRWSEALDPRNGFSEERKLAVLMEGIDGSGDPM